MGKLWRWLFTVLLVAGFGPTAPAQKEKLTAEQIVARHLASIGAEAARAAVKTREVRGEVKVEVISGGSGVMTGPGAVDSAGREYMVSMDFNSSDYSRERLVYADEKVDVGHSRPGVRSPLGNFLLTKAQTLSEGLFSGTLSTGWALLHMDELRPKLKYEGLKKVDGRPLYQFRYRPRHKGGEMVIHLYFDPVNFSHVKTVYSYTVGAGIGSAGRPDRQTHKGTRQEPPTLPPEVAEHDTAEIATAKRQESRFKLEEFFSDFRSAGGLQLPTTWRVRLTTDASGSSILQWTFRATDVENNADVGPGMFTVKQ